MNKILIPWKAYPMDRSGVKSPRSGVVEIMSERIILNRLHEEVTRQVYLAHPELRSTPLIIGRFIKENAA